MLLRFAPLILFAVLCLASGVLSDRFLSLANFRNILTQSTHVAVMAIGMTFVLLVRGVDLSVGSVMYLVAVVMGLYLSDVSLFVSIPAIMVIGAAFGAINACLITGLRIAPFIVTLATLFIGRGFALYLSETKMVFQSDTVQALGRASFFGVPWAIWIAIVVASVAWVTLTQTPYGRQIYAVGADPDCGEGRNSRPGNYLLGVLYLQCLRGHRRVNLGFAGRGGVGDLRLSGRVSGHCRSRAWRHQSVRRSRRGVRQHLWRRAGADDLERPRHAERKSLSLSARQQCDHLHRRVGRWPTPAHD
jgi:hypothetical protein